MSGNIKAMKKGESIRDLAKYVRSDHSTLLDSKDFYKELRLRGYHYAGIFKSVTEVRGDGTVGKIKWNNNWPAFMDCMLQVNILAIDSRSLYLPTSIRRIRINTEKHLRAVEKLDPENPVMEVRMFKELGIVSCGGIEIEGLVCSSVSRRKAPGTEVLESYEFIPYNNDKIQYSPDEAASIVMQLALENLLQYKIKIVEVDANEPERKTLIQVFDEAIVNIPLVMADLTLLCKEKVEIDHVKVADEEIKNETNCQLIIGSKWLNNNGMIAQAQASLTDNGFLLLREQSSIRWNEIKRPEGFNLISLIRIPDETLILLQRIQPETGKTVINIDSKDVTFKWLQPIKEAIKHGVTIALEQNSDDSGLLGLINCIRREPGGDMIRCVLIDDKSAPQFDLNNLLYSNQMKLDLTANVYRHGQWGAYRHLTLKKDVEERGRSEHYYANLLQIGDLSSFEWMTGWINATKSQNLVNIQYSAINFRDVMMATGRLPIEANSKNRLHQQRVIGFEFSGTNKAGERLMGMAAPGSMATQIEYVENLTWKVPASMSLRDAATIPVVYTTIYYAFFFYKPISRGKSILIHAGSGGVGLAAIRIALAYGMEVYTTCSSEQKKKFIMEQYPQIKEENIGNSRDCSFEQMIMFQTKGNGVDYVLNSLAEEKLAASVRCLGDGGVFLEIGKFDIMNDSNLAMGIFAKEIQFRAVFADNLIHLPKEREILSKMIEKDLESGLIQPLHSTVFQVNEVEKAFRYLSTGKHVGKVLIQIRENENSQLSSPMRIFPRACCDPDMVYIIAGGLGGFGLELADWLILRGCRKLVLSSRTGVKSGYQAYRIKTWESYGCKIIVSTADITTHQGCKNLIVESLTHGAVGGIFNLAVLLRDGILENQSCDKFVDAFGSKVLATRYLDELSRVLCEKLHYFVVFSSASCGRGNAGQTNYGMANSIMERIIEKRVRDNLPGKAIQWGAIGEVGLVAQMTEEKIDLEIAGTVQQRIAACLNVMDSLLSSKQPVVSSMVVAQKHTVSKMNLIQSVLHIMGIRDIKSVSKNSTLAELGMDSLMAVEIKQVMEREFDVNLTAQDLRYLTFAKLQELTDSGAKGELQTSNIEDDSVNLAEVQKNMMLRSLGNEQTADKIIIPLNESDANKESDAFALFIPGIEGVITPVLHTFCKSIKIPIYALQFHAHSKEESFSNLISLTSKDVLNLFNGKKKFILIGHSFGGLVAISLTKMLEQSGLTGEVIVADGSVSLFRRFLKAFMPEMDPNHENVENFVHVQMAAHSIDSGEIQKIMLEEKTYEDRIDRFLSLMKNSEYSTEYLRNIGYGIVNRVRMILRENEKYTGDKIESNITLIRPKIRVVHDIDNDYQLSQYTNGQVFVNTIEGNHLSMLNNMQLYQIINDTCLRQ